MSCLVRRKKDPPHTHSGYKGSQDISNKDYLPEWEGRGKRGGRGETEGEEGERRQGRGHEQERRKTRQKGAVKKVPSALTFLSFTNRKTNSILRLFFLSTKVLNET